MDDIIKILEVGRERLAEMIGLYGNGSDELPTKGDSNE
jgi:hypothetical protein